MIRFATVLIQVSQHSSDVIFASSSDHELIHADPTSCTFRASESEVVAHGVSEVSSSSPNKLAGMNRVTLGPGEALLYYNTHVNGSWDLESEHVICPSDEGNRIVAHKWIW